MDRIRVDNSHISGLPSTPTLQKTLQTPSHSLFEGEGEWAAGLSHAAYRKMESPLVTPPKAWNPKSQDSHPRKSQDRFTTSPRLV